MSHRNFCLVQSCVVREIFFKIFQRLSPKTGWFQYEKKLFGIHELFLPNLCVLFLLYLYENISAFNSVIFGFFTSASLNVFELGNRDQHESFYFHCLIHVILSIFLDHHTRQKYLQNPSSLIPITIVISNLSFPLLTRSHPYAIKLYLQETTGLDQ